MVGFFLSRASKAGLPGQRRSSWHRAGLFLVLGKQVTRRAGLEEQSQGVKMALAALEMKNNY